MKKEAQFALLFFAGLVVGIGGMLLWYGKLPERPLTSAGVVEENSDEATPESQKNGEVSHTDSISVFDQPPGSVVQIGAKLNAPTWVVIHEDVAGAMGNALGAAWFIGGEVNSSVPLLRGTEGNQKYHAVLYRDNGNKIFELKTDTLLRNGSNTIIRATFTTTSGAAGR